MFQSNRVCLAGFEEAESRALAEHLMSLDCDIDCVLRDTQLLGTIAGLSPHVLLLSSRSLIVCGIDTCRQVKASSATKRTMILMVAARDFDDVESAIASGIDDLILEPVSPTELVKRVENLLKLSHF